MQEEGILVVHQGVCPWLDVENFCIKIVYKNGQGSMGLKMQWIH